MDMSTAPGVLIITVLRLLHIVAGLVWVGAAIVMSGYIVPARATSVPYLARQRLDSLTQARQLSKAAPGVYIHDAVRCLRSPM